MGFFTLITLPVTFQEAWIMYKKLLATTIASSLLSLPALAINDVVIAPSNSVHSLGEVFSIDVLGQNFTTALDAGGLNLSFDSAILSLADSSKLPMGVTDNVQYKSPWTLTFGPTPSSSSLNDALFFADTAPSGNFSIFTVWFEAVAPGTSALTLTESAINPFAGAGGALATTLANAQVSVVPLPPTAWLWLSGLVLLGVERRIRANKTVK
jgi:hypothetical protein